MTLADDIHSMFQHTKDVYDAVEELGGTLPENKNLANLVEAFESIPGMVVGDGSLSDFQLALNLGLAEEKYPIGDKVHDNYDGLAMDWRIVHYGSAKLTNEAIEKEGVYLQQEFVYQTAPLTSANYAQSNMIALLNNGEIYNKFSADIKALAKQIEVPYSYNNTSNEVSSQFFIPSATELSGEIASGVGNDGVVFDYYKQFAPTPTNNAISGRIQRTTSNVATSVWLRTSRATNLVRLLTNTGSMMNNGGGPYYVSVVCFIPKD